MAIDARPDAQSPTPPDATPRRRPWVAPLLAIVVLAILAVAGMQVWRFAHPPQTATSKPTLPDRPPRPEFKVTGTVSRTGKDGQKVFPKDATVRVVQPTWTPEQQQEWEKRVNDTLAKASKELGGEAPPTVTADPASVIRADQEMSRRQQAAKAATPWKHQCTTEDLALLKETAAEANKGPVGSDGAFSLRVAPPAGIPYIVHATSADGDWVAELAGRSGKIDLNDSNLVPD